MGAQGRKERGPHEMRPLQLQRITTRSFAALRMTDWEKVQRGRALDSPRPHIRFRTAAQPRLQAPWIWRHLMARVRMHK